ncbi:MAG: helix-turn-helix domain-containing protein [Victivallaceae bacterium]|nr:helix-turn-helix domain-containing protein [Victivallaceae bacterium]
MMKQNRAKTILLAKNFLSLPEIRGILDYARAKHWMLRVPRMLNLAEEIRNWDGDGVLIDNACGLAELKARGIAVVATTDLLPDILRYADAVVASDDTRIGYMAADYFMRRGYRNYLCAAINARKIFFAERLRSYGFSPEYVSIPTEFSHKRHERELESAVRRMPRPFCIFCDNDFDASVVADAVLNVGLKIPRDAAILGVGNEGFFCNPKALTLSSVDSRLYERAFFAAERMDFLLDGKLPRRSETGGQSLLYRFAPSGIVERESTDFYAIDDERVQEMVHFLLTNAGSQHFRVASLTKKFLLTESSVYRLFQARFGISPKQFLQEERLRMAQRKLMDTDETLPAIADECGFPGPGALHSAFKRKFGIPPNEYRLRLLPVKRPDSFS